MCNLDVFCAPSGSCPLQSQRLRQLCRHLEVAAEGRSNATMLVFLGEARSKSPQLVGEAREVRLDARVVRTAREVFGGHDGGRFGLRSPSNPDAMHRLCQYGTRVLAGLGHVLVPLHCEKFLRGVFLASIARRLRVMGEFYRLKAPF